MFRRSNQSPSKEEKKYENPLDELMGRLDELEELIDKSMEEYIESIRPPAPEPKSRRSSLVDSLKKLRRSRLSDMSQDEEETPSTALTPTAAPVKIVPETPETDDDNPTSPNTPETPAMSPTKPKTPASGRSSFFFGGPQEEDAKFLPMDPDRVEKMVEVIRRIAELVIIGERAAGNIAQHKEKVDQLAKEQHWGDESMSEKEEALRLKAPSTENDKYLALFERFFERNGLALITNVLTGACFDLKSHKSLQNEDGNQETSEISTPKSEQPDAMDTSMSENVSRPINLEEHDYMLLPPLAIATQAIQSVSILVQNVSRATSLFFILSNNHVNELINFPLEQYHIAERRKHNQEMNGMSPRRFGSPELAELTTHFVTFLKSLAMRINIETLQFFLRYPSDMPMDEADAIELDPSYENPQDMDQDDRPLDENENTAYTLPKSPRPVSVKTAKVEFQLYERALEFCSAHQDSFVRVTAMNICLNILRLATVSPKEEGDEPGVIEIETGSSPDGVLHNAKALPLRERFAIAQYVCTPSRVERLASPIFGKLAQLWGILEEQFREMDDAAAGPKEDTQADGDSKGRKRPAIGKVARAKETARRLKATDSFNDTAYSVQDELLLLEDVLKVGLTSLNEQTIEMMFATFVYPLLLQPLLLYFQRSPVPDEVLFADPLNDHTAGREIQDSGLTTTELGLISSPTKSAFFCLGAAFQFITNKPLLRLLFTALFHPMSPEATGETMIRAKADVACIGADGKVAIRIDPLDENGLMKTLTDRSTYVFGTVNGRKCKSGNSGFADNDEDSCVFVLCPALSEILEFKGDDGALVARTRHNPYRKAIFKCFTLCSQLSDLRPLSVLAFESAVSVFDEKFLADILFGLDWKKFEDNMPIDERTSDSQMPSFDDRGIGGGTTAGESRLSLGEPTGGRVGFDHMNEVLSSFRSCLMKAVPGGKGTWKLEYDLVAAHALLCVIRGNRKAIVDAARGIDRRCRQAAAFLSDTPQAVERFGGAKLKELLKGLDHQEPKDDGKINGTIMDILFMGYGAFADSPSTLNDLIELKAAHRVNDKRGHAVSVSSIGSYNVMCSRCCAFPPMDSELAEGALKNAMGSAQAWVKLDALSTLLNSLVATGGSSITNRSLGGFAVKRDGSIVATNDPLTIYSHLSEFFLNATFDEDRGTSSYVEAQPGTVVSLIGHTAFPCVCEVPPSSAPLFSEAGAKVVSQGITWQSLYLVILGHNLVMAEPERKSSGDGRVVTRCMLHRLMAEKDSADARTDTSARRLIMSYDGSEISPPGLFLFEETPSIRDEGPFIRLKQWRSSLDVWFEDNKAVELAFCKVNEMIDEAKAHRGRRIQRYLAQGEGSGYPTDIPVYKPMDTI